MGVAARRCWKDKQCTVTDGSPLDPESPCYEKGAGNQQACVNKHPGTHIAPNECKCKSCTDKNCFP
jgi:hypothetical protein|eukprot:COSAG01_NODE_5989_length_3915_cov_3.934486_1_plen_66_part_00